MENELRPLDWIGSSRKDLEDPTQSCRGKAHRMAKQKQETVIERGSGNVFTDLGFDNADEMLAKAKLVRAIAETMDTIGVTQVELAGMIGIDQSKVSKLLRGITDGFSSDRLMRILTRLDRDVEIIIRPKPQEEHRVAHVSVAVMHSM